MYIYDHMYRKILVLYKIYMMCYCIEQNRICIKKVIYLKMELSQFTVFAMSIYLQCTGCCWF